MNPLKHVKDAHETSNHRDTPGPETPPETPPETLQKTRYPEPEAKGS